MKSKIWIGSVLFACTLLAAVDKANAQSPNILPSTTKAGGWAYAQFGKVKGTLLSVGQANGLEATIGQADGVDWHGSLTSPPVEINDGGLYTVSFAARASAPLTIAYDITTADGDFHQTGFYAATNLTTTLHTYRYSFHAANSGGHRVHVNFLLGGHSGSVWISSVKLMHGAPSTLSADSSEPGNWTLELHDPARATIDKDGEALRVTTTAADGTDWHVQIYQNGIDLVEGQTYTISFDAKANRAATIYMSATSQMTYKETGLATTIHLTPTWQHLSYNFKARNLNGELARIPDLRLGGKTGVVWVKDATLTPSH